MKVVLMGEAGSHRQDLERGLNGPHEVLELPHHAQHDDGYDDRLSDADVIVSLRLTRKRPLPDGIKLFQVPGAGLDAIDLTAIPRTTTVCNVYEHEIPIAEYVLAAMLNDRVRPHDMRADFASRPWGQLYSQRPLHGELWGKTVGLVGYGRIGRAIAARASAFGTRVLAVDDYARSDDVATVWSTDRLAELLATADFVLVACPLTDRTRGMIDADALNTMKPTGVLINISRAHIVDEDALYEAVRDRRIAGAVLDVWYRYPSTPDDRVTASRHDFAALDNVWCTPHSSAWTAELSVRRYTRIAENINRLAAGEPLINVIDRD